MLIASEDVIRASEAIYRDFEVAKLEAYRARPGNPNRIEFASFRGAVATLGPYVGYFNRVYGFTAEQIPDLGAIVRFYEKSKTDFELTFSPLDAGPEVGAALVEHGFRPSQYHAKFFLDLGQEVPPLAESTVTVSAVGGDQRDAFLDTMLEGWGMARENWEGAKENMRLRFGIPGISLWWGRVLHLNIGGAILYVRDGVAYLADAATIPSGRKRGCQLALIHARISHARSLGCGRLFGCAPFGGTSARNMQRAGLRLAASDMTWLYRFPGR